MKIQLIIILLFTSLIGMSQVNGLNFKQATPLDTTINDTDNELHYLTDSTGYFIQYNQTDDGLKKCMDNLKNLLLLNDLDFNNPTRIDEYYSVREEEKIIYRLVSNTLLLGNSYCYNEWDLPNGYRIMLVLDNTIYAILIFLT